MAHTAADDRRRSLGPLRRLAPYIGRYKGLVAGAAVSLVLAAVTTLTLPVAVRRMIDFGFSAANSTFIANYFSMLVVIAALLALASAGRYYFVITLGERVVADLRRDVFSHVTTLSPSFFDAARSGEIVSRLAADTTQIKSAVGATASVALRNVILCVGAIAMMVVTSPKLSGLVLAAIPVIVLPLVAFGRSVRRKSRQAQDTLADATAYASEQIGAVRTLQAFTNEKLVVGMESVFSGVKATDRPSIRWSNSSIAVPQRPRPKGHRGKTSPSPLMKARYANTARNAPLPAATLQSKSRPARLPRMTRRKMDTYTPRGSSTAPYRTTVPTIQPATRQSNRSIRLPAARGDRAASAMPAPRTARRMPSQNGKYPGPMWAAVPRA